MDSDLVANVLLAKAAIVRSDEIFLWRLLTLYNTSGASLSPIKSLVINTWSDTAMRPNDAIDLRRFDGMHTFKLLDRCVECDDGLRLPSSVTHLRFNTSVANPIHNLHDLTNLTRLRVSFSLNVVRDQFKALAEWPKSLTSLTIGSVPGGNTQWLEYLPSTLTHLGLRGIAFDPMELRVPACCTSLTSLKVAVRSVRIATDLALPPSLTSIRLLGIEVPQLPTTIADVLGAIPNHVTQFSFSGFSGGEIDMNSLTIAYAKLLPRLSFEDVNGVIGACLLGVDTTRHFEMVALLNATFARFGFDNRYLQLLLSMCRSVSWRRNHILYSASLPTQYVDAYLSTCRGWHANLVTVVYGGDDAEKEMEWSFQHTPAMYLELLLPEKREEEIVFAPLPCRVRTSVRSITVPAKEQTQLSGLFSAPMPALKKFTTASTVRSMPIDTLAKMLYDNRHNLPNLENVEYSDSPMSKASVRMFAEMKLYKARYGNYVNFYASPPAWALAQYPFLQTHVAKMNV